MANNIQSRPIRIDTFGADVIVSADDFSIVSIFISVATSDKSAVFIDSNGAVVAKYLIEADRTLVIAASELIRYENGFIFDDSASGLASGDIITIHPQGP